MRERGKSCEAAAAGQTGERAQGGKFNGFASRRSHDEQPDEHGAVSVARAMWEERQTEEGGVNA